MLLEISNDSEISALCVYMLMRVWSHVRNENPISKIWTFFSNDAKNTSLLWTPRNIRSGPTRYFFDHNIDAQNIPFPDNQVVAILDHLEPTVVMQLWTQRIVRVSPTVHSELCVSCEIINSPTSRKRKFHKLGDNVKREFSKGHYG